MIQPLFLFPCFTTDFPSSKTSSMETRLTWATVTVRERFYCNYKTPSQVDLPFLRLAEPRPPRFPPLVHFELLFCSLSLGLVQFALSIYGFPFISNYSHLWASLGGVRCRKSIVHSEIFTRRGTPLISLLISHRQQCALFPGPTRETSSSYTRHKQSNV